MVMKVKGGRENEGIERREKNEEKIWNTFSDGL